MSTNYFKPPSYQMPRVYENAAEKIDVPDVKSVNTNIAGYDRFGAITGGANYAARQDIINKLAQEGNTSIYQQFLKNLQAARTTYKGALSGYGGLSFKEDDTSTPQREDLEIRQETGITGAKEVEGIQNAQALAASRGISGRAQSLMVGAALQRVSEQARAVINQYSDAISGTKEGGAAYEFNKEQQRLLTEWGTLYGADLQVSLAEQLRSEAAAAAAQQKAERDAAAAAAANKPPDMPIGKIGQYKTKALAQGALEKLKSKYSPAIYELSFGKPAGKDYFVIMAKKR